MSNISLNRQIKTFLSNSHFPLRETYVLLHTFAHLFIREISNTCGYSVASIREKIYCYSTRLYRLWIHPLSGRGKGLENLSGERHPGLHLRTEEDRRRTSYRIFIAYAIGHTEGS